MDIERERLFRNFDWGGNSDWQTHIRNVYPAPSSTQILRIKRKWYQRHIDPNFRVDASPSAPPPQPNVQRPPAGNTSFRASETLAIMQLTLFLLAPTSGCFMHFLTAAYFAGMLRKLGSLTLRGDYWTRAMKDENAQSMAFCFLFVIFQGGIAIGSPIVLGIITTSAEIMRNRSHMPSFLMRLTDKVNNKRDLLLLWKSRFEVALVAVFIIYAVLGRRPALLAFVYAQFQFIKYTQNAQTQATVRELKSYWEQLQRVWRKMVRSE